MRSNTARFSGLLSVFAAPLLAVGLVAAAPAHTGAAPAAGAACPMHATHAQQGKMCAIKSAACCQKDATSWTMTHAKAGACCQKDAKSWTMTHAKAGACCQTQSARLKALWSKTPAHATHAAATSCPMHAQK